MYESGGSERVSKGFITDSSGGRWHCTLEVPIARDSAALLTIEREASEPELAPAEATLVVPAGELNTLLALLGGVIAQARADGVLNARASS
jgi:hypothetical protein